MTSNLSSPDLQATLAAFDGSSPGTPLTTDEIRDRLDVGGRETADRLERLVDDGHLATRRVGEDVRIWWRTDSPADDARRGRECDVDESECGDSARERRREQLVALNNLNDIVHEIIDAVLEQSTREEIEAIVCERLAESDSYLFAWIGGIDAQSQSVNLRAEAGVEGYLDGITISVDSDDVLGRGPTGRAALNREVQVVQDASVDDSYAPWREQANEYGFRSSAAIPIVHDETVYGVLNVYAERPNAFSDDERAVIGRLGEVIGHAIAAIERKRVLMSDEVIELEFQMPDVLASVDVPDSVDGTVTLERLVPLGDGVFFEYGVATDGGMEILEGMVASEADPDWESVTVLRTDGAETYFELRLTQPPILSTVVDHGGSVREVRIEDDYFYMRIHLAPSVDVRRFVDAVTEVTSAIELITQQQVTRDPQSATQLRGTLFEALTERQRAAIEAAYHTGYFSWPRKATGEEIAASLDVSSPTFHQHLRTAEAKLLAALFGDDLDTG